MKVLVLTISDRAFNGEYEDLSGPAIEEELDSALDGLEIMRTVVPDESGAIEGAFRAYTSCRFIITTGGTGISSRDVTPDVTMRYCDKMIPGIAETLRSESYKETPNAMLSRGVAGLAGNTIIINVPGSQKAARFCARLLIPVLKHAPAMLFGKGH